MTTTNKGLNQPSSGSANWDVPLNANFGYLDSAFGGVTTKSVTGVSATPVVLTADEYRNLTLSFSGTLTANVTYQVPSLVGGQWIVKNSTTGAFTLTIGNVAAGTSVVVPQGATLTLYSDGTNIDISSDITGYQLSGKLITAPSSTSSAGLSLPAGTAPTSPVNGDLWTTTSGLYARINGSTIGPFGTGSGSGSVTSVSGTGTVNGITLTGTVTSSGSLTLGGTLSGVSLTTQVSGTLPVANGGTGSTTLTGYVKGTGTTAMTASSTIPNTDITGLGTISTQASSAVSITGGAINGTTIGATTPDAGSFTTLSASSNVKSNTYLDASGGNNATINGITPISSAALTTSAILSATAGAALGAIGTYAYMATSAVNTAIGVGTSFAGSTLRYSNGNAGSAGGVSSPVPSGTWMAMGYCPAATSNYSHTLFLRIT